jgi:nicotinate-nucleotide pyrophosphorylase (carboxylating)
MGKEFQQIEWDALVADECRRLVRAAVLEDLDRGQDWTTLCLTSIDAVGRAAIVARQAGVIAGLPALQIVIDEMDRRMTLQSLFAGEKALGDNTPIQDGMMVQSGTPLGIIEGPARSLLTAERLILNLLGRLSGIATQTHRFVEAVAGTKSRVYDTRKTTPGWRRLEKYAVRQGGGCNHRTGLFDAILIKDNHLALGVRARAAGHPHASPFPEEEGAKGVSPARAVQRARQFIAENFPADDPRRGMIVEVEVDSLVQLQQVLPERPDIVLLDNMSCEELRRAVQVRNSTAPNVELEASGGVTLASVRDIAETGVERISSGALTHSAVGFDVGLDWET